MRTPLALLVLLLALPIPAAAQQAWLRDYREGVKAFNEKNFALAEEKLRSARDRGPQQSRQARSSGLFTEVFIPDYYLGLIHAQRGEHSQAIQLLESALARGLITEQQKAEFQLARTTIDRSKEATTRLAQAGKGGVSGPGGGSPGGGSTAGSSTGGGNPAGGNTGGGNTAGGGVVATPKSTDPPEWVARFRRSYDMGRTALRESRYADARTQAAAARAAAGDQQSIGQADALRREIEVAQDQHETQIAQRAADALRGRNIAVAESEIAALAGLDAQHPSLTSLRLQAEALRRTLGAAVLIDKTEREAIRQYFAGNYQGAAAALQRSISSGVTSPRIHLYLACSQAALALMADPNQRAALVTEARRRYSIARPGQNDFARDRQFISPRVLALLEGSS